MFGYDKSQPRTRKGQILVVGIVVMTLLLSGCGQVQAPKVYRVGVLSGLDAFAPAIDGLKNKMTELGYVEGKNIIYDVQSTNVDIDAYKNIARKFVEAKAATQGTGIPVVFDLAFTDVKGIDLINSVREPGGNITGVRFPSAEIASKRLEILLQMVPTAKRIWVPYLQGYPNVPGQLDAIRPLAQSAGVTLSEFAAASPPDLQAELDKRAASGDSGMDAILLIAEPLALTPDFFAVLGKFGDEHQIPIGGALMTVGDYNSIFGLLPNAKLTGEQAAVLVDKVLKGTSVGTIPVVTAESDLNINYKAAQELGITVPDGLLAQAAEVIR